MVNKLSIAVHALPMCIVDFQKMRYYYRGIWTGQMTLKTRYFVRLILIDWLVDCFVLRHINPFQVIYRRIKSFWLKFPTIQFSISIVFVYTWLNVKTALFQTIQFSLV